MIRNDHSGMCVWTDGQPGDGIVQEPCDPDSFEDIFHWHSAGSTDNAFQSRLAPVYLDLDVSGCSYNEGANIDGWYSNGQLNQDFGVDPATS